METNELVRGRYRLLRPLGQGGQGTAYLGEDTESGGQVVVKLLRMSDVRGWTQVELFEREARVLKSLNHPSIPRYVDSFAAEIDGQHTFGLVQQYIAAPCLRALVSSGWRGTEEQIRDIGARLLAIVGYIHSLRPPIVHRDINPKNVLRSDDGTVYLVDFGGVQDVLRLQAVGGNTVIGTPGLRSPGTDARTRDGALGPVRGRRHDRRPAHALRPDRSPDPRPQAGLPIGDRGVARARGGARQLPRAGRIAAHAPGRARDRAARGDRRACRRRGSAAAAGDKPFGSRIQVREGRDGRVIVVPEGVLGAAAVAQGGFSAFWLAFVAFWTVSAIAMGAPIFFPLFSIPFWCVGIYLMYRTVNSVFGRSEIVLGSSQMTLVRRLFSFSRAMTVPLSEVGPCRIETQPTAPRVRETVCVLEAGAVRMRLGTSLTDREKEWLCRTINAHLESRRPPR